jgi:putative DNA primase/helicase
MTPRTQTDTTEQRGIRKPPAPRVNGHDPALTLAKYEQNDIGNAHRLLERYGYALRFVVNVGWYAWDGKRWARDEGDVVARHCAQETAKAIFAEIAHISGDKDAIKARAKWAISSGYSARLTAMLSQAEPHVAISPDDIDQNPWLFNCRNGTLNLQTRELKPHDPTDLITKLCPVDYDPAAAAPTWLTFLEEIFAGDEDLIGFVQRGFGYSLTGITREHVLFIMHGAGSNGKSVLLETIVAILSDYARQCPSDTFTAKDRTGSGISNDIARLVGSRLVSVVETDQDKRLAEGLVKQATGGDRMAARYMRQEFFEFTPKFKLWLATNHKPRIRGTDHGIWRRIRLIPFLVTFYDADKAPEGEPIKNDQLADKLKTELPGVLAWLVRGCSEWQETGLTPSSAIEQATTDYRQSQDVVAAFLDDCCDVSPNYVCRAGLLYKIYKKWALDNGEILLSGKYFGDALTEKGLGPGKGTHGTRVRKGLDLKEELKNSSFDGSGDEPRY